VEPFLLPIFATAMIAKLTDLVAFVTAQDWKSVLKQVVAYVGGIGTVAAVKAANFAPTFAVPGTDQVLSDLNAAGTVLLGVLLASGAGVTRDFINSRDAQSSSRVPQIGGDSPPA
jgi:hypothetical protein